MEKDYARKLSRQEDYYTQKFSGLESLVVREVIKDFELPFSWSIEEEENRVLRRGVNSWMAWLKQRKCLGNRRRGLFRTGSLWANNYSELGSLRFWNPGEVRALPEMYWLELRGVVGCLNEQRKTFYEENVYDYEDMTKWLFPRRIRLTDTSWEEDERGEQVRWIILELVKDYEPTPSPDEFEYATLG